MFALTGKLFQYRNEQIMRALNSVGDMSLYSDIGVLLMKYSSVSFIKSPADSIPLKPFTAE